MMRKTSAIGLSAALLTLNSGTAAFAQAVVRSAPVGRMGVPVVAPTLAVPNLSAPTLGASLSAPRLTSPVLPTAAVTPSVQANAAAARAVTVQAVVPAAAAKAVPSSAQSLAVTAEAVAKPGAASSERGVALEKLFTGGRLSSINAVALPEGSATPAASGLSRAAAPAKAQTAAVERTAKDGGLVAEVGIAATIAVIAGAVFSPSFRGHLKRMGQVVLGWIGIGVKKAETPEVMAARIIDQLNAAKPVYNRKVQQASTLVEKLRLQVRDSKAKVAELQKNIDAILTDSDPANDDMALGMINTKGALESSIAATAEQTALAEKTLASIKEERARFFSEREEMLAKVQAGLTRAKQAEIQKEMAELRGGFEVGDLKDNMDRFEDVVRDREAEARGTQDSVESNPDEVLRKAKDEYRNNEARQELEKRKKELAEQAAKNAGKDGALAAELGIAAAVAVAAGAIFSPSFRGHLKRMGQVILGWIGIGVKKAETPEVMAARIIDQLNAAKPVYNRKVQQASTMVEKLRLQIRDEKLKVADMQKSIDAVLTDSDPANDDMALGLINTKKAVEGSIAASAEQLGLAEKTLVSIKEERARFFAEREEMLAKVQAGLTRAKQAEIQKEMAELRGGFEVGDLSDNMDRFEEVVRDREAEARGTQDSVESNPDEALRKAKDEYRNREAREELERRKKELSEKNKGA